jgi:hypothetical protein
MRFQPDDIETLCVIGRQFAQNGFQQETRKCYRAAVDALRRFIRAGHVDRALAGEQSIYAAFVNGFEDEQHYYRCFADWKDDLAALGRRFRDPAALSSGGADRIAFFLHTGDVLGHTEVLLKTLELRPLTGGRSVEPRIYVLDWYKPELLERCRAVGVDVCPVVDALGTAASYEARFQWLRERFRQDRVGVCVWVSAPIMAAFALSMRLAPVQIYWALRFHPVSGPYIDGYISWGAPDEQTRRYGRQEWEVVPMTLALDTPPADSAAVDKLRRQFPEPVLLGTLGREEKINSAPYLRAVAGILSAHPEAGFLWTGRTEHPAIAGQWRAAGVADRCHFVGWVDTRLYAAALDVFLETFPFGSGITSFQAFAAGVPLLSYLHPETIFGTYFWERSLRTGTGGAGRQPHLDAPDSYPILCAREAAEYVSLAGRLITDAAWRKEIGARGQAFYHEETANNRMYAERFFATVARIAAAKLGGSGAQAGGG